MNFDVINKKDLKTKPSSQIYILSENNPQKNILPNRQKKTYPSKKNNKPSDKPVNAYYYKQNEENKENQDDNMKEFMNRMQNIKKGEKIFGSYKKSNYLNNQYSIERYYKYNKIVNRLKMEDEQLKKNNRFYSSPLQNLDSSESDTFYKKQALKALKKERQTEKIKKNKKPINDPKLSTARPTLKYNGYNQNNTIQYSNNDNNKKQDYNYNIPPKSPTKNIDNNYDNTNKSNNNDNNNNKKLTSSRRKIKNDTKDNNKLKDDYDIVNNKINDNSIVYEGWKRKNDNKLHNNNNNNNNNNYSLSSNRNYGNNNNNINNNLHYNDNNDYDEILDHDKVKQNLYMISNKNKNNSPLKDPYLSNQKILVNIIKLYMYIYIIYNI